MPLQATESHSKPRKPTNPTPDTNSNFQGPYRALQSPTELSEGYVRVLDKGFVSLKYHIGGDLSVANGARVSFHKQKESLDEADEKLINFLMSNGHGSVFEHNSFKFHIQCPLKVARQVFRHRISSFNEWSGRYSKPTWEFYIPSNGFIRTQVGKPGSYTFEPVKDNRRMLAVIRWFEDIALISEAAYRDMTENLDIAKELASFILPMNLYTEFIWTINARSLMNFLSLRNHSDALKEIREYAIVIEDFFKQEMPITYEAFVEFGRRAP